jgi:FkbH-like protein
MRMTISQAIPEDLKRVEELTIRTHQLNSTGYTYSYEELEEVIKSNDQLLLIAGLEDKYGTYGKIGLAFIKCEKNIWTIKLLLMSCRVISRGVGTILLNYIMKLAKHNKVSLQAEFVPTSHNKMMYITYIFSGFKKVKNNGDIHLLQYDLNHIQKYPSYIEVTVENDVIKVDAYAK